MKKTAIVFLTHLFIKVCIAQQLILPGNNTLNPSLLKPGNYSMAYYFKKDGQYTEIGTYNVNVFLENQKLNVNTSLSFHNSSMVWNDGFVANIHSFTPVSSYIERDQFSVHLNYSNTITGEYIPKKNGKKKTINIAIPNNYFNISFYPYIIRMLPLETGYKATIPVYDYEASDNNRLYNIVIKEVKSNIYQSTFTGEYKVWKVSVFEESTGHYFDYYIDKQTRRLWEVQILSKNGDFIALYDKEIDFNPFKNKFNKEETYNLVNNGNATIKGVAYAKDGNKLSILNINKKQFAAKGTKIVLMPYTNYYKEWIELNKKQEKIKNAQPIQLSDEAIECIKYTFVYDGKGNFEFTNLKPGEYMLYTSFGYERSQKRQEVVGESDVYYKGAYLGTRQEVGTVYYSVSDNANIQKIVTIKTDDEVVEIKLKKTR